MLLRASAAIVATILLTVAPAIARTARDEATIQNSGSTNLSGYVINVWPDGSARASQSNRGIPFGLVQQEKLAQAFAQKFFADLSGARKNGATGRACMKSASFGSSTIVRWRGWTSPDLECPGDRFVTTLASDVHRIADLLHVRGEPHRIPLPSHEPHRPPTEASPPPEPGRRTA